MIGKQGHSVLVTLIKRKTQFTVVIRAANKTARDVTEGFCNNFRPTNIISSPWPTTMAENLLKIKRLHHSWEKGLNESTNGLIRQYLPKGKDINDLSDQTVAKIIKKINQRPRKCLGFNTTNRDEARDMYNGAHERR